MVNTSNERANELELKQQFLDRAKALSKVPEVFRSPQVTLLICDSRRESANIKSRIAGWPGVIETVEDQFALSKGLARFFLQRKRPVIAAIDVARVRPERGRTPSHSGAEPSYWFSDLLRYSPLT